MLRRGKLLLGKDKVVVVRGSLGVRKDKVVRRKEIRNGAQGYWV